MASEFPDGGVNLKETNQTPLSPTSYGQKLVTA
jgi:hypothetical protein